MSIRSQQLRSLERKKILVAGDLMLDVYTFGEVQRISPEAPVPIVSILEESQRPGGAGNVFLNLAALGMEVVALGRLGKDAAAEACLALLQQAGIATRAILTDPAFVTPVKNRIIAGTQQLLRIDREMPQPLSSSLEECYLATLPSLLEGVSLLAISDYAKGFLTPRLLHALIGAARDRGIAVIVDPKGVEFTRYQGATLLKPNLSEAVQAAHASGLAQGASLDAVAQRILQEVEVQHLMITRSKEGISLFNRQTRWDFSTEVREIRDVTGAGDTVLATLSAALANQMSVADATYLANVAAGMTVEKVGCVAVSLEELMARLESG